MGHTKSKDSSVIEDKSSQKMGIIVNPHPYEIEKRRLLSRGVKFRTVGDFTLYDLKRMQDQFSVDAYRGYDPPNVKIDVPIPENEFDSTGFDAEVIELRKFQRSIFAPSFLADEAVETLGTIDTAALNNSVNLKLKNHVFITTDNYEFTAGEDLSVYSILATTLSNEEKDQVFLHKVVGKLRVLREVDGKFEAEITNLYEPMTRGMIVGEYESPYIRPNFTQNSSDIEAQIVAMKNAGSAVELGDIIYLDRGSDDGVSRGNIFDVFSRKDLLDNKIISEVPAYSLGEILVLKVSPRYSTGVIVRSNDVIRVGDYGEVRGNKLSIINEELKELEDTTKPEIEKTKDVLINEEGQEVSNKELEQKELKKIQGGNIKEEDYDLDNVEFSPERSRNYEEVAPGEELEEDNSDELDGVDLDEEMLEESLDEEAELEIEEGESSDGYDDLDESDLDGFEMEGSVEAGDDGFQIALVDSDNDQIGALFLDDSLSRKFSSEVSEEDIEELQKLRDYSYGTSTEEE